MSIELAIVVAIKHKLGIYPWMETFFINDEEIIDYVDKDASVKIRKRALNKKLRSMRPVFLFHETLKQNGTKRKVYAFNSWELAKKVSVERDGDNVGFILKAMIEYLKMEPDERRIIYQ